jgi:hypothetical protein
MGAEMDLMQRLAVSKKIMERTEQIKPGSIDSRRFNMSQMEEFEPVNSKYNLPEDLLSESTSEKPYHDPTKPLDKDRVLNSKLPDEIKQLMIENPIVQPNGINGSASISEEVIQGAQRLMNKDRPSQSNEQPKKQVLENSIINTQPSSSHNISISENCE